MPRPKRQATPTKEQRQALSGSFKKKAARKQRPSQKEWDTIEAQRFDENMARLRAQSKFAR